MHATVLGGASSVGGASSAECMPLCWAGPPLLSSSFLPLSVSGTQRADWARRPQGRRRTARELLPLPRHPVPGGRPPLTPPSPPPPGRTRLPRLPRTSGGGRFRGTGRLQGISRSTGRGWQARECCVAVVTRPRRPRHRTARLLPPRVPKARQARVATQAARVRTEPMETQVPPARLGSPEPP